MKTDYPIPTILKDRPVDDRGYVIPYFVPIIDGKPDFRYQDGKKREICLERKLCSICGKLLYSKRFWFISGPIGLKNKTASDAPMHEDCARYSINVCPHMLFFKAERKSEGGPHKAEPFLSLNKPPNLFLIRADKFNLVQYGTSVYIKFRPVYAEEYIYVNNKLVKKDDKTGE